MPLTPYELIVVVLAGAGITRLVAQDTILDAPRDAITNSGRARLAELVQCTYCAGAWLVWLVYVVVVFALGRWDDAPVVVHLVTMWAARAGQMLVNIADGALHAVAER